MVQVDGSRQAQGVQMQKSAVLACTLHFSVEHTGTMCLPFTYTV